VHAGIVYRRGPSFQYTTQSGVDPLRSNVFRVPDTLAVGLWGEVRPRLTVAGEVTRVTYSRLTSDFVSDQAQALGRQLEFTIDDGTELHVAAEYALPRDNGAPVRLRLGTWYDPDHSVHFSPSQPATTVVDRLFDERLGAAISQGRSRVHVTGGLGLTVRPRLEFNAAVDATRGSRLASVSFIVHVGKETFP
jgi:hypothetical protein